MLRNQKNNFMMKKWKIMILRQKKNEEDEEEPAGINETDELAVTWLDEYADHNIEEATIFPEFVQEARVKYFTLYLIIIIN